MRSFPLQIVTADGMVFDGQAESISVRAAGGDMSVQAGHCDYVTVLGIYYKLQTFLYLPANGIVQGMRPLVGYNYGAREHGRVSKLYNLTLGLSAGIMAIGTLLCLTIAGPLMGLFTSNPETIAIGQTALRIICLGFIVSAVSTTSSGALEGLGKGVPSLVISPRYCQVIQAAAPSESITIR